MNSTRFAPSLRVVLALSLLCGFTAPEILAVPRPPHLKERELHFQLHTGVSGQRVSLASELTGWRVGELPFLETSPGHYELTIAEPWLHELQYKFVIDGSWIKDPTNLETRPDGHGGENSYLAIPGFREDPLLSQLEQGATPLVTQELWLEDRESSWQKLTLASPGPKRGIKSLRRHAILYFQDGEDYLYKTGVLQLLANLSADPALPVFHAVFIPPKDRMREYGSAPDMERYARFVAETVVPAAEARLGLSLRADQRLLIGPSLGGLITLHTSLQHPAVFPLACGQSSSIWYQPTMLDRIERELRPEHRWFVEVGTYEHSAMVAYNRRTQALLERIGARYRYEEYPSTHDWIGWRNRLQRIVLHFFKPSR